MATAHPSWFVRTARWIAERFPLPLLLAILGLYALATGVGYLDASAADGAPQATTAALLLGAALVSAWFLMIRTLDDLEDQPEDDVNHPERALQRGAISRGDLLGLVGFMVVTQGAAAVAVDRALGHHDLGPITTLWLGMAGFLAVLAVDFGAPRALAARPGLRRALRAPASVFPVVLAFSVGYGAVHVDLILLLVVAVIAGIVAWYDITRRPKPEAKG